MPSFRRIDSADLSILSLDGVNATAPNFRKAHRMNKRQLLTAIVSYQNDLDVLNGKLAQAEMKLESTSLKDWSDVLNKANELSQARAKKDTQHITKSLWKQAKSIYSELSFTIKTA